MSKDDSLPERQSAADKTVDTRGDSVIPSVTDDPLALQRIGFAVTVQGDTRQFTVTGDGAITVSDGDNQKERADGRLFRIARAAPAYRPKPSVARDTLELTGGLKLYKGATAVIGLPGSGKTVFAKKLMNDLAVAIGAIHFLEPDYADSCFDRDEFANSLAGAISQALKGELEVLVIDSLRYFSQAGTGFDSRLATKGFDLTIFTLLSQLDQLARLLDIRLVVMVYVDPIQALSDVRSNLVDWQLRLIADAATGSVASAVLMNPVLVATQFTRFIPGRKGASVKLDPTESVVAQSHVVEINYQPLIRRTKRMNTDRPSTTVPKPDREISAPERRGDATMWTHDEINALAKSSTSLKAADVTLNKLPGWVASPDSSHDQQLF